MKKVIKYITGLWKEDKWLFWIFAIGMVMVIAGIFYLIELLYITFFSFFRPYGSGIYSREYLVSQSWTWAPIILLGLLALTGPAALIITVAYIVVMKMQNKKIEWKRTIALGTLSFWSFFVWLLLYAIFYVIIMWYVRNCGYLPGLPS